MNELMVAFAEEYFGGNVEQAAKYAVVAGEAKVKLLAKIELDRECLRQAKSHREWTFRQCEDAAKAAIAKR